MWTFSRLFQVGSYLVVCTVFIGLTIFVCRLLIVGKPVSPDAIVIMILGQMLNLFIALTNKIHRVAPPGNKGEE